MRDEDNRTPLIYAVRYNKLSMVQLFVNHGVDVSVCNEYGHNVFHYCVIDDSRKEILSLLLQLADTNTINKCNKYQSNTFVLCIMVDGQLENVRLLLSTDIVDVDIGDSAYDDACGWDDSNKDNKAEIQRLIRDYKK